MLSPFLWVVALMVSGMLSRNLKVKKSIFRTAAIVFLLFSNPFLQKRVAHWWDYQRHQLNSKQTYSCAIVLGGFVSEDSKGNGFFNGAADRFIQGIRLKATGQVSHLLVTGGNASIMPDHFSEGNWVVNELKALHVPYSTVLIENKARNTIENAQYSKVLLQKAQLRPPYLLVTSAFHMRRALATFKQAQLPVVPYACNFGSSVGEISLDDFIPQAGVFDAWSQYIKEMVGLLVLRFRS